MGYKLKGFLIGTVLGLTADHFIMKNYLESHGWKEPHFHDYTEDINTCTILGMLTGPMAGAYVSKRKKNGKNLPAYNR